MLFHGYVFLAPDNEINASLQAYKFNNLTKISHFLNGIKAAMISTEG